MSTEVSVKNEIYQITIPAEEVYENEMLRDSIDMIRGQQIIAESQATDEQIAELADEVTNTWWKNNKDRILDGLSD